MVSSCGRDFIMIQVSSIPLKEVIPGYKARFIHTAKLTLAFWEVEPGAAIPLHNHLHEQTMQVLEGEFEFTVAGVTHIYKAGSTVVIPPYVTHGGKSITACKLMDIFCPVREDYKAL